MTAWGRLAVLLCAAVAIAAPAADAWAKPGYQLKERLLRVNLPLPASNGYSARIETEGHRQVTLRVSKGAISIEYKTLGKVSRKGIEAGFGPYGQVSLRFRAKSRGRATLIPGLNLPDLWPNCKGRDPVLERGIFHGNVRFEGERGFTEIKAHRMKGRVRHNYRQVCRRDGRRAGASALKLRQKFAFLGAHAQIDGVTRYFALLQFSLSFGGETEVITGEIAGRREKVGRVAILKSGFGLRESRLPVLVASPLGSDPLTAEVNPAKPFSGTGSYQAEGNMPATWTGTLGIRLPGSGLVPLAGPEFEALLCQSKSEAEFSRCVERLAPVIQQPFRGAAPTPSLWRLPGSPR